VTKQALNRALLARQMLLAREQKASPVEVIEKLAGLQAQQARPPFVGLWSRIAGFERQALVKQLNARKVVRATLMRGTLHLVSAKDYLAFRGPVQPALSAGFRSAIGSKAPGLDMDAVVAHARGVFNTPRTFADLRTALAGAFPKANDRAMGYGVRTHLPLVTVTDDPGWGFGPDSAFALAEAWLGKAVPMAEAADALIVRYLAAFGPATVADAQAWSGLRGLQPVFERLRPKLVTFAADGGKRELFDLPKAPRPDEGTPVPAAQFIAAFDNVILAHADRSRIIADEHRAQVVTKNLLVLPTFLVDGFVAGTWQTAVSGKTATLTVKPFAGVKPPKAAKALLAHEAEALVRFIEPESSKHEVRFA
jgi:hypothetical protein